MTRQRAGPGVRRYKALWSSFGAHLGTSRHSTPALWSSWRPPRYLETLRARPLRSFLTAAGIALGVAVLFALFATLAAAQANPESLLAAPAILDEVQRYPELLLAIKKSIDEQRQPGRFILSGSANLALLGHVSETLGIT